MLMKQVTFMRCKYIAAPLVFAASLALTVATYAQASARVVGTITAISGHTMTVKPDTGAPSTVAVSDGARILRTEPGAKKLSDAKPIAFSDLAVGDRVLALVNGGIANIVVAMKHADIAQRQEAETADWQRRGSAGLVKAVNAAAGTITIAAGARTLTVHVTPSTTFRRYSAESARFADTTPSTIAAIHPGDQLRVLGNKSADGTEIAAEEVVSGSFRNIAGPIVAIDSSNNTITVNDLIGKKPIIIHIAAESQLHKLPPEMAALLAKRLKRFTSSPAGRNGAAMQQNGSGGNGNAPSAARRGDLGQMLKRTPTITLADLHKGDDLIIVATQGTPRSATAITLLAGVEPILRAFPSGNQSMFSASWNLTGSAPGGAGGGGGGTP